MSRIVNISFPVREDILLSVRETKDEFTKEVLFLSALFFYRKRKLSLGNAAELAGYSRLAFIEKLQMENEDIFDYNAEDMDEIFEDSKNITENPALIYSETELSETVGKEKEHFLDSVKKHRFSLPPDYCFDREELHER